MASSNETRLQARKRQYNSIHSQRSTSKKLIEIMMLVSDRDVNDIFARLKSGADIEKLVSHLAEGDTLLPLSVFRKAHFDMISHTTR
jgi:hypothetical protein